MNRTVQALLPATEIDMGGFPVKQALPTMRFDQVDPFLLLHHGHAKYSGRRPAKQQGIGPHPHRGFSPVTFVVEGAVHHRDSRGNSQVAVAGEVQWMHAGAGIIHSERPSDALAEHSGKQEIIQLWINSPAAKKMVQPAYYHLSDAFMPKTKSTDGLVTTKLVAGKYGNNEGGIPVLSEMIVLWSEGESGGKEVYKIPKEQNAMLYLIKGAISLKGYGLVEGESLVIFKNDGEEIEVSIKEENTQFLVLSGAPLNEKIAKNGPFVMNTETQILEAMRDYQMGKMGVLIEDELD